MLKKTSLAALACTIALSAPAFGQSFPQWAPHASLGGAVGGYGILGTTRYDNAPLLALGVDRYAHVTGNYKNAIAQFDRVIKPDGTAVIMRRISPASNPDQFVFLPSSWPAMGALGKERVMDASGRMVAERDVIISQYQIMAAGIPMSGPPVATLAFERTVMPDGTAIVTASAQDATPGVALALAGNTRPGYGIPWQVASR